MICDRRTSNAWKTILGPGGVQSRDSSCSVPMDTWSPRGAGLVLKPWKTPRWSRATVYFIRVILAVWSTITKHRDGDTLLSSFAGEVTRLAVMHRHFPTTRGRCGKGAGSHQLICRSRGSCFCKQSEVQSCECCI